jgi:ferritin-like metal-binding protein YciE
MKLESLTDLYLQELEDLYDAEKQLAEALPKLAGAAFSTDLRDGMNAHLEQTKVHMQRLDEIFKKLKQSPKGGKRCRGMEGILREADELLKQEHNADPDVLDAALIAAAQRAEHYEIASYGCARTYAAELGAEDAAKLLQQTLDEESNQDKLLTALAETMVNLDAAEADKEMMQEAEGGKATNR